MHWPTRLICYSHLFSLSLPSLSLFVCLSLYLSISLFICLSLSLFLCLSLYLSISPCICLPWCPFFFNLPHLVCNFLLRLCFTSKFTTNFYNTSYRSFMATRLYVFTFLCQFRTGRNRVTMQ